MASDLYGRLGGVYIDFENLKYTLDEYVREGRVLPTFDWADLLYRIKERIEAFGLRVIIGRSYADFDNLGGQGQLQLLGFDPRFILASPRKNSADIQLSIDVMEALLTRPEITDYIIVAGDRDYLPIVRKIQEHAKRIWVMGFERATSGDLRTVVGDSHFIKLDQLVPETGPVPADERATEESRGPIFDPMTASDPALRTVPSSAAAQSSLTDEGGIFQPPAGADADDEIRAIKLALEARERFGTEIWLTPFLRDYMNDAFPYLNHQGRKGLVERLRRRGAIRIYQRDGQPQPYSVFEVNLNDPVVRGLSEGESSE